MYKKKKKVCPAEECVYTIWWSKWSKHSERPEDTKEGCSLYFKEEEKKEGRQMVTADEERKTNREVNPQH